MDIRTFWHLANRIRSDQEDIPGVVYSKSLYRLFMLNPALDQYPVDLDDIGPDAKECMLTFFKTSRSIGVLKKFRCFDTETDLPRMLCANRNRILFEAATGGTGGYTNGDSLPLPLWPIPLEREGTELSNKFDDDRCYSQCPSSLYYLLRNGSEGPGLLDLLGQKLPPAPPRRSPRLLEQRRRNPHPGPVSTKKKQKRS